MCAVVLSSSVAPVPPSRPLPRAVVRAVVLWLVAVPLALGRPLPCWCGTLLLLYSLLRFLPFPLPPAGRPSSLARILPYLVSLCVARLFPLPTSSFSWSSLSCLATAFHLYIPLLSAPSWSSEPWTWVWVVAGVAVMTMRATTTMQSLTVMTMLRRWRYPFGLPSVVCVCVWRCRGFPIRPYHIHGVGDLQSMRVDRAVGWLGLFTNEYIVLALLVLAFCHTLRCLYLRVFGHRAYLLLFLCSGVCVFCCGGVHSYHALFRGVGGLWFFVCSQAHCVLVVFPYFLPC